MLSTPEPPYILKDEVRGASLGKKIVWNIAISSIAAVSVFAFLYTAKRDFNRMDARIEKANGPITSVVTLADFRMVPGYLEASKTLEVNKDLLNCIVAASKQRTGNFEVDYRRSIPFLKREVHVEKLKVDSFDINTPGINYIKAEDALLRKNRTMEFPLWKRVWTNITAGQRHTIVRIIGIYNKGSAGLAHIAADVFKKEVNHQYASASAKNKEDAMLKKRYEKVETQTYREMLEAAGYNGYRKMVKPFSSIFSSIFSKTE